jgi:mono/diheme cytochrome c family protein
MEMRSRPARKEWGKGRALLLGLFLLAGCGTVKSPTEPAQPTTGGTALTFAQIQAQIFTPVCAKAGCHAAGSSPSGLVLEAGQSYGNLVGRPAAENSALARVSPGNPNGSYIILKLRGDPNITGERMPLGGPYLSADQIAGIAAWIQAGAPNN